MKAEDIQHLRDLRAAPLVVKGQSRSEKPSSKPQKPRKRRLQQSKGTTAAAMSLRADAARNMLSVLDTHYYTPSGHKYSTGRKATVLSDKTYSKWLCNLRDWGAIKKSRNGFYKITPFGRILHKVFSEGSGAEKIQTSYDRFQIYNAPLRFAIPIPNTKFREELEDYLSRNFRKKGKRVTRFPDIVIANSPYLPFKAKANITFGKPEESKVTIEVFAHTQTSHKRGYWEGEKALAEQVKCQIYSVLGIPDGSLITPEVHPRETPEIAFRLPFLGEVVQKIPLFQKKDFGNMRVWVDTSHGPYEIEAQPFDNSPETVAQAFNLVSSARFVAEEARYNDEKMSLDQLYERAFERMKKSGGKSGAS